MAKNMLPSNTDAAGIKPRLIPDFQLLGRDDSGGMDFQPYTAQFGDGGFCQGEKPHLSWDGSGKEDEVDGDTRSQKQRTEVYKSLYPSDSKVGAEAPASSKKLAKE